MKTLISCAYNMDNCCVEVKFSDGSMIAIDTMVIYGQDITSEILNGFRRLQIFHCSVHPLHLGAQRLHRHMN